MSSLINCLEDSGDKNGSISTDHPSIFDGDFASPEQIIPPQEMQDESGVPIPWEPCATMNNHWDTVPGIPFILPQTIIRKLVECVSKRGNMILNVGPDAKGRMPDESVKILEKVGHFMNRNGESSYGCGISKTTKP